MKNINLLFDYQKFANHKELANMISDVGAKYFSDERLLTDDEMNLNAAGDVFACTGDTIDADKEPNL